MIYILCYDISDDKIRTKVSKILIAEGYERIQFSIFIGNRDPKLASDLWERMKVLVSKEKTAKFYVFKTSERNFRNMDIIGNFEHDVEYLLGDIKSLLI